MYVLVGLCMMISFLINNKIHDGGFLIGTKKKLQWEVFEGNRVGIFKDTIP
jgi:hypothetical protein